MVKYIEANIGERGTSVVGKLTVSKVEWIINELQLDIDPGSVYMVERANTIQGVVVIFKYGLENHRDVLIERGTADYYRINNLRREATDELEGANEFEKIEIVLKEAQNYKMDKCVSEVQAYKYFKNRLAEVM